jgi:hypothetical protein
LTEDKENFQISALGKKIISLDKGDNKDFFINVKCFLKVCELLEIDDLIKFYNDLCVCFLMMGFHSVANYILDRLEENQKNLKIEEKLNLGYLRINIFLDQKKFWEAASLADEFLLNYPLTTEEEKCFSYLKAEAKFFQKMKTEAKIIYLGIKKISPGYRLVEKRLLEIESNK